VAGARYVLLGLAQVRSEWFRQVSQWATTGGIAAEFVKCVSAEEVRARLGGGRQFSALLVDATLPSLDRDLIDTAQAAGCTVIVVDPASGGRDWRAAGADALLHPPFDRTDLLDTLSGRAAMIGRADGTAGDGAGGDAPGWLAPVVAVTGPGGTGASTAAIALAQGLAADVRSWGSVLLADFCLHAEQAMLHDARDVVPGVQELVDAFRAGQPGAAEIRALTFAVPARRYHVLLGLRRARAWSTIRPRAFEATLDGLRRLHRVGVADLDSEVEGEDEGGSVDVEERHVMARATLARADAVVVVGAPGMKGLHALTRVLGDLLSYGVPGERLLPVVNRAPRGAHTRAQLTSALAALLPAWAGSDMPTPIFLPERHVDELLRDGARLPDALVAPLTGAVRALTARADDAARRPLEPELVTPGSLGTWTPEFAGEDGR
jgi:hypothetical protein